MSKYQKKNMLIGGLLAIVVLMGIAYAAFASNLTITGSGSVSSNWCIGFDSTRTNDYQATAGKQGGTTPTGSMSFDGQVCSNNYKTNASLNASFIQPGDKIEYTLTIGNKGTLAAAIESINVDNQSVTSDTTITKGNIKYIIEMPETTSLAVNATTTMKVTAMFQNDTEVTSSTNEQQTISISINAVQDDGNGGFTPTPTSQTVYAINTNQITKNTSTLQDIGTTYNSCSATEKNVCLRYTIENDIVTGAEACFLKGGSEHCLKGWVDESSLETTPVFNSNKLALQGVFTEENACSNGGDYFECRGASGWLAGENVNGYVDATDGDWRCDVDSNGSAFCYYYG